MVQVVWDSRRLSAGGSLSSLATSCGIARRVEKEDEDSAGVSRIVQAVDGRTITWDEGREKVHMADLAGIHFLEKSIALSALQPSRKLSGSGDNKDTLKRTLDVVKDCQVPPSVATHCLLTAINHSSSDKVPPIVRQLLLHLSTSSSPTTEDLCQKMLLARRDSILQKKPIFFICNPFGGRKKAAVLFNDLVSPLFHLAGQAFEYRETEHAGHAAELIKALDFSLYSGIVTISGDGVFHEVIDAMISRPDWPTIQSIPVGIIGGGSGNGMSKNVNSVHPELACMAIINSTTLPTDIFSYVLNNELHFSHLSVTWAFIADLDIESDRYRWLGPERFTLAAIVRMVRLRTYTGRLFIRPFVEGTEKPELKSLQDFRALHPSSSAEYESWPVSFKGEFRYFMATNYRYIATDFMASPETGLNSGFMSVLWSPEMSRQQILDTLMDSSSGAYASHPQMFSQKTSAFVLEPGPFWLKRDGPVSTPGILNVSGEQVPYCPISVVLHPGLLSCFVYDQ